MKKATLLCMVLFLLIATVHAADRVPPVVLKPLPAKYADNLRMFQGIPSLAVTDNKTIWVTWYSGGVDEDRDNVVLLVRSRDGGKTWSKPLLAIDQDGEPRQYDPSLWFTPDKKLRIFWSQRPGETPTPDCYTMYCDNPNDDDPQWSSPQYVTRGVCMNKGFADSKGRWIIPVSHWRWEDPDQSPAGPTGAWAVISEDQGKSWKRVGRGYTPVKKSLFDEHSIVELRDGRYWLLNRTKFGVGEFFSSDGCKTWTEFREPAIKHTSSRFFIRRLQSGNLIFVKNGPMNKDVGRINMTAFLSKDDGKTWQGGLLLDDTGYVSYPDGDQTPDGKIWIVYDTGRYRAPMEIRVAQITEADILAGKLVSLGSRLKIVANKATGKAPFKFNPAQNMNADGEKFRASAEPAQFKPVDKGDQVRLFKLGDLLFTNRGYRIEGENTLLKDRHFLFSPINKTKAVCTKSGMAYVLTPVKIRNKDTMAEYILKAGFKKVATPEFLLFGNTCANVVTLYQKEVQKGETVEFGMWGILLF